jgi:hypothetical protein
LFAATLAAGCATVPLARAPGPTPDRFDIRALTILPASPHACPGQTIGTRYVATLGDGSRVSLERGDLSLLLRRGVAAEPRGDGSWQTNNQPLASAVSGFQLSALLASDTSVRADTTIVPTCDQDLRAGKGGETWKSRQSGGRWPAVRQWREWR